MPISNRIADTQAARRMERISESILLLGIYLDSKWWANPLNGLGRRNREAIALQYFVASRAADEIQKPASRIFIFRSIEQHVGLFDRGVAVRRNFPSVSIFHCRRQGE